MTTLTPQAIEFMLMTGMSDDPAQDVSKLPVMEQVAIYSMNYTQQQSDVLKTQQAALSQITTQINNNNYVSQLAEIRSKIVSGTYSWPTDSATCAKLATALDTDAAFGNWATPPSPPVTSPVISPDDYKLALSNGQGILDLLTPTPKDGTSAANTWPSDAGVTNSLILWCQAKNIVFPPLALTPVVAAPGPSKLTFPALIVTPGQNGFPAYVDVSGNAISINSLQASNVTLTYAQLMNQYAWCDPSLWPPGATSVTGNIYGLQSDGYGFVFAPNSTVTNVWSDPAMLSTVNGSSNALPLWQDGNGNTYMWTVPSSNPISSRLYYGPQGTGAPYFRDWINGQPEKGLLAAGLMVRYQPVPNPTTLQGWASAFATQQNTIDSNNRQLNADAQSQMLEVQLAGTNYENGQQYASGTLGKNSDTMSGIIRNF